MKHNTLARLAQPALAALAVISLTSGALAQRGSSSTTGAAPTPPTIGIQPLTSGGSFERVSTLLPPGTTCTWNTLTGKWIVGPQAFSIAQPLPNPRMTGSRLTYQFDIEGQSTTNGSSFSAGLEASWGLASVAASLSTSSLSQSDTLGVGLSLVFENSFEAQLADIVFGVQWVPEALAVFAIRDPEKRRIAWQNAGFGEFIVVGAEYGGRLGVTAQMGAATSMEERSVIADLAASYGNVSANVSLDTFCSTISTQTNLELSLSTLSATQLNVVMPPTRTKNGVLGLDDPATLTAFVQTLLTQSANAISPVNGLAIPVECLTKGPTGDGPWLRPLVAEANNQLGATYELLGRAQTWNSPSSLVNFLDMQTLPGQAPETTYWDHLNAKRSAAFQTLLPLFYAMQLYVEDADLGTGPLVSALAAAESARKALASALHDLEIMRDGLPRISLSLSDNHAPQSASNPDVFTWVTLSGTIDNALIEQPALSQSGQSIGLSGAAEVWFNKVYSDVEYCNFGVWDNRNHGYSHAGGIGYVLGLCAPNTAQGWGGMFVNDVTKYTSGPSKGLYKIDFEVAVPLHSTSRVIDIRVRDILGRDHGFSYRVDSNLLVGPD